MGYIETQRDLLHYLIIWCSDIVVDVICRSSFR